MNSNRVRKLRMDRWFQPSEHGDEKKGGGSRRGRRRGELQGKKRGTIMGYRLTTRGKNWKKSIWGRDAASKKAATNGGRKENGRGERNGTKAKKNGRSLTKSHHRTAAGRQLEIREDADKGEGGVPGIQRGEDAK